MSAQFLTPGGHSPQTMFSASLIEYDELVGRPGSGFRKESFRPREASRPDRPTPGTSGAGSSCDEPERPIPDSSLLLLRGELLGLRVPKQVLGRDDHLFPKHQAGSPFALRDEAVRLLGQLVKECEFLLADLNRKPI